MPPSVSISHVREPTRHPAPPGIVSQPQEPPQDPSIRQAIMTDAPETMQGCLCECSCGKQRIRAGRLSDKEKLLHVMSLFKNWHWTFGSLIRTLIENRNDRSICKSWNVFLTLIYEELPAQKGIVKFATWKNFMTAYGWEIATKILRKELEALSKTSFYSKFDYQAVENGDLKLGEAQSAVETIAPQWVSLLHECSQPARNPDAPPVVKQHVWILANLLSMMHHNGSDNLQSTLGLYLYQGGCKRQVIDTFNRMGLSKSYTSIRRVIEKLTVSGRKQIVSIGGLSNTVVTYDNFETTDGVRGERVGSKAAFRSITTALAFHGQGFPSGGLKQSMWNPERPLIASEVLGKMKKDEDYRRFRKHCLEDAVRHVYHSSDLTDLWTHPLPEIEKIPKFRTQRFPLRPIMRDEATVSNNIYILDDIFAHQFGMNSEDSQFQDGLRLVYGDLKTVSRMLSVKLTRKDSRLSYDAKHWVIPCLGLWHLMYNFLMLLHIIHWGSSKPMDSTDLQYAADRLNRHRVAEPKDFKALEDLILHSYYARIVGWLHMRVLKHGINKDDKERVTAWLRSQTPDTWKRAIEELYQIIHPDVKDLNLVIDQQYENNRRFCNHVEAYLQLRYAIRYSDIGLLRRAMRECCLMMQSPTGHKTNYAREMIRQLHLTDSSAADKELQDAILKNAMVNLQGKDGKTFETDRLLELFNLQLRTLMKNRSSSTLDIDSQLEQMALCSHFFSDIRENMSHVWGVKNSGKHTEKDAMGEVIWLAKGLWHTLYRSRTERSSLNPAVDLLDDGKKVFGAKVLEYNAIACTGGVWQTDNRPNDMSNICESTAEEHHPIVDINDDEEDSEEAASPLVNLLGDLLD